MLVVSAEYFELGIGGVDLGGHLGDNETNPAEPRVHSAGLVHCIRSVFQGKSPIIRCSEGEYIEGVHFAPGNDISNCF